METTVSKILGQMPKGHLRPWVTKWAFTQEAEVGVWRIGGQYGQHIKIPLTREVCFE